jgi:hypothetical protein
VRSPSPSWLYLDPPEKRTFHLFSGADRSSTPYTMRSEPLTPVGHDATVARANTNDTPSTCLSEPETETEADK